MGHYLQTETHCTDIQPITDGSTVHLPDGHTMRSTHTAPLQIPHLPPSECKAHIFPQLANNSLISISQLCGNGCMATFTHDKVTIHYQHIPILHGYHNYTTGLWYFHSPAQLIAKVPTGTPTSLTLSSTILNRKTTLVRFYHQACFSPTTSAFLKSIDAGHFSTWPGFTSLLIKKHLHKSGATIKGHLHQQFHNLQTTQPPSVNTLMPVPHTSAMIIFSSKLITSSGRTFSNQTGRFPITSSHGNKYIMVVYCHDVNAILVETMK